MRSLAMALAVLVLGILFFGCKKELKGDESDLYGTWVKGSNLGDTLWFMKKSDKHIIRMASYSSQLPIYDEKEYRYKDGKLSLKLFVSTSQEYYTADTFNWITRGEEFTIQSTNLYPFSSYLATFRYKKL